MHFTVASCCGPTDSKPPTFSAWAVGLVICGVLLFIEAPVVAATMRGDGTPFWRRKLVVGCCALGAVALVLAQRIADTYHSYLAQFAQFSFETQQRATDAMNSLTTTLQPLAYGVILLTLGLLIAGALYVVSEAPSRRRRQPAMRTLRT